MTSVPDIGQTERPRPGIGGTPAPLEAGSPVAIEVRNVSKTFQLPGHRIDTLKELVVNPFSRSEARTLHTLRDISFEVRRGEFFGIVGRNGSGKSTLLKIIAGIYAADQGRIRMAGSLAPFIELGVGFNTELTAPENIILNGVMMGLTREEAEAKIDSVLKFAELEEFVEMKLKNYSSGMHVRLAFSVMVQAETDILLIDEVLAVGDAAFQQKCADVFREMRDSDRTVILVTHDMRSVDRFCHRAMLINDGRIDAIGDPHEVGRRYLRLNFEKAVDAAGLEHQGTFEEAVAASEVRLTDLWLEAPDGSRTPGVEQGATIKFHAILEAREAIEGPMIGFSFSDANGITVFAISADSEHLPPSIERLAAGESAHIVASVPNKLATGRYDVACWVWRNANIRDPVIHVPHALDFVVYGSEVITGLVALDHEIAVEILRPEGGHP